MSHRWECPDCSVGIEASNEKILAWASSAHRCDDPLMVEGGILPLAEILGEVGTRLLDKLVLMWLVDLHGRPFRLYRADGSIAQVN